VPRNIALKGAVTRRATIAPAADAQPAGCPGTEKRPRVGQWRCSKTIRGENWGQFNRIALWIYPDCPGFQVVALELRLYNDGAEKLPAPFGQEGETTVILRNHEWNRVVLGDRQRDARQSHAPGNLQLDVGP